MITDWEIAQYIVSMGLYILIQATYLIAFVPHTDGTLFSVR